MSDNNDGFVEAGTPNSESWDPEVNKTVAGKYVKKQSNIGPNNSEMYYLEVEGTEGLTSVWGSTVLDNKFEEVPLQSQVKIEYLGKAKGKSGTSYKDFKVMYKAPEVPQGVAETFPGAESV